MSTLKPLKAFLDVHLMVSKPSLYLNDLKEANVSSITFHVEAVPASDVLSLIREIKTFCRVGMAIKPGTSIDTIIPYIDLIDMVLVMTVEPGFGGQKLMNETLPKVRALRDLYPHLDIEVDGGISMDNIEEVARAGANVIVSGTGIIKSPDWGQTIREMRSCVSND